MEKDYDFKNVGKRMPYKVPGHFFDSMEANVLDIVGKDETEGNTFTRQCTVRRPHMRNRNIVYSILAVAAVALLFVVEMHHTREDVPTLNDVDQAFDQLSIADQQYMLSVYQEDEFMNY